VTSEVAGHPRTPNPTRGPRAQGFRPQALKGADDDGEADQDDEKRSDRDIDPVDAADPGELDEPALCPCGQGYVGHADHGLVVQVLEVEPPHVATFTARPDGTCSACGRPEADHDRRHDLPDAPAYCLVQPASVALLHAVTLPGEPCRVACEPRMAAEIAERLAADGQPCYAVVEAWQLI